MSGDGFETDLLTWVGKVESRSLEVFSGVAEECERSIRYGSAITGAPGQPVSTGFLRASWQHLRPAAWLAEIFTNTAYAPVIEEDLKSAFNPHGKMPDKTIEKGGGTRRIKSTVGGHHSLKMTINSFNKIVEHVTRRVNGGSGA